MYVQAQLADFDSDRELDVAEALFDLANVAVAFEQADSADTRPYHDSSYRHTDKHRRSQVFTRCCSQATLSGLLDGCVNASTSHRQVLVISLPHCL